MNVCNCNWHLECHRSRMGLFCGTEFEFQKKSLTIAITTKAVIWLVPGQLLHPDEQK